jgi:hypothetical protein
VHAAGLQRREQASRKSGTASSKKAGSSGPCWSDFGLSGSSTNSSGVGTDAVMRSPRSKSASSMKGQSAIQRQGR